MECLRPQASYPPARESEICKTHKIWVHLNHDEIVSYLPVYIPNHVYLKEAEFDGTTLHTQLQKFDYPFTMFPLDYIPGTYAVLYICQAAYLLGALTVRWTDILGMNPEEYRELMLAEQIVFTAFSFKFRKFVPNDGFASLKLSARRTIELKGKILTDMGFSFGEGIYGSCLTVIARDHSIKRQWSMMKSLTNCSTKDCAR